MPEISYQLISEARALSGKDGTRMIEILQQISDQPDAEFVTQLAAQFHFPALAMVQLHSLDPTFDVVSYPEAVKRGCMIVQDGADTALFLFSDPFDQGLRAWAPGMMPPLSSWRLVHHSDLSAYLAQQEHRIRAVDDALLGSDSGR